MKFDQLQYFFIVSQTQHIGQAAKRLNISASAVSHSIALLEEELGQTLVEKTGKNIRLTAAGKRLAERAEFILAEVDRTKHELASDSIEWQGTYRVGATHGVMDKWIVPNWGVIQKQHPKIVSEFFSLRSAHVVESVHNGILDLGICYAPLPTPGVNAYPLLDVPLRLVVRAKHKALSLKDDRLIAWLNETPGILPKAFQGIDVCEQHPEFKRFGITPQLGFLFDSYDVACGFVRETDSWAMIPEPFCTWYQLSSLALTGWKATTQLAAVSAKGRSLPKPLQELIQKLKEDTVFSAKKTRA